MPSSSGVRGLFVTGTGTGVGKTIVSTALLAAMRASGEQVRAYKPVITGLDEPPGQWPPDHELLALAADMSPEEVSPLRYGPAVSPHLAAALAGESINPADLVARARDHPQRTVVVEGVGGLLVPLTDGFTVRDLAVELALPLVIAASPSLGTINHTLLTLEVARDVGLDVRAVVLTPWPAEPSELERSNRETIEQLGEIEVALVGELTSRERAAIPAQLAQAGKQLPWQKWLSRESFVSPRS